ncbi:MAG: hypothetical protein KME45_14365 [Stenomitos rutilans HA7619-LM2]|jgi:hypothetical protein|nr:hypothetical protein [Stenomitos rutilans HA7619-LM2]
MFSGLVTAVATTYEQRRSGDAEIAQFKVGDQWTAYVQPTGDFIVRNEARRTICRGNLHTGEETMSLSEEYAGELERECWWRGTDRLSRINHDRPIRPILNFPLTAIDSNAT